jgi:hypothetical protein
MTTRRRMARWVWLIPLVLWAAGGNARGEELRWKKPDAKLLIIHNADGSEGALVPASARPNVLGAWTPTPSQIRRFEAGLAAYLRAAHPADAPDLDRRLSEYRRQYYGITQKGKRLISVFFFCKPLAGWSERLVEFLDGGSCFFDMKYDPSIDKYLYLYVHGDG